ncbi:sigma-54 dependent transcriptional regulator [Pseudohaliea sp.]|uniref:sigma-54-dependent transcriptional regulator n=1 Tax=Pseudohaliea sp. TaxID=2740289 RepID=UPI0032EB272F
MNAPQALAHGEPGRILVVEDDATLREALQDTLLDGGYEVVTAADGQAALLAMDEERVDLVISDVQMDRMDGQALLREVRRRRPELPFVMITAHGSVEDAVHAMRGGATDYLLKPFPAEALLAMVERLQPAPPTGEPVAEDPATRELLDLARRIAASDATVLISGESGTGKEVLARYLHNCSPRASSPFLAVNCAAIPENMLESMLFGYEKGAYTGAHQSRPGKFEQANGGTLLLDEVSEMDLALQAKLLRVLQEREVERLGGQRLIPLDVRVLATTNRRLADAVAEGAFREDLYYRLNVLPLTVPPLRDRPGDILALAESFLARYSPRGRELVLAPGARERLLAHGWRGNVRELENCMQRTAILAPGEVIGAADIEFGETPRDAVAAAPAPRRPQLEGDLRQREQEVILDALTASGGSRKAAAERLGISPRTLRYKLARMKEQGVPVPGSELRAGGAE